MPFKSNLWQFLFCPRSDFNAFFPDVFFFILRLFLLRLFSLLFYFSERIRNSSYQKQEIKQGLGWIHCQNKTICSWGFYSEDLVSGPFPSSCVCFMWFRQSFLWVGLPLFIWENMAVYSRTCSVCTIRAFSSLKGAQSQMKWKGKLFLNSCDCCGLFPDMWHTREINAKHSSSQNLERSN